MVMEALGYNFTKNEMDDTIYFNGVKMDDFTDARIRMKLLDHGYKSKAHIIDAMLVIADDHRFHPIRSYLRSTKWNGEDSIAKLASYFQDSNGLFPLLLRKWLIGAVNRVLTGTGEFNPMLVLDGPQRIGKSKFARWLCSGNPAYWGLLNTMQVDKDEKIKLSSFFILEAPEISALFSKADREALKVFLSMETVTERAPYGKFPLNKPVTASFIGTLNNIGGFLSDSTGESRFRTCTIQSIDWRGYIKNVDIDQVWAQAVALWDSGETIELSKEDQKMVDDVNQSYKMEDTITKYIDDYFEITQDINDCVSSLDIEAMLRSAGAPLGSSPTSGLMRIANELKGRGLVQRRILSNGTMKNTWFGIKAKETPPFDAAVAAESLFQKKVKVKQ
jgi:predicted P-loop ATPase